MARPAGRSGEGGRDPPDSTVVPGDRLSEAAARIRDPSDVVDSGAGDGPRDAPLLGLFDRQPAEESGLRSLAAFCGALLHKAFLFANPRYYADWEATGEVDAAEEGADAISPVGLGEVFDEVVDIADESLGGTPLPSMQS